MDTRNSPRGANAAPKVLPTHEKLEKLRNVFEKNFRPITAPVKHDRVSVLLLSWEQKDSDIHVMPEIRALREVLETDYQFSVQWEQLKEEDEVGLQLDSILMNFMYKSEGSRNLCIVYYAGHGFSGNNDGELNITNNSSQQSQQDSQRDRNTIAWHGAENVFKRRKADILVIFDCCEAGALRETSRSRISRSFEFLGACERREYTPGPGRQSFTSALIWALRELKHSSGFDSVELKKKIESAPHKEGRYSPVLFSRESQSLEHIWIYPKALDHRPTSVFLDDSLRMYRDDRPPMESIDLRFRFSKHQDEKPVEQLAESLSHFAREQYSSLGVRHVELIGCGTKFKDIAQGLVEGKRYGGCGSKELILMKDTEVDGSETVKSFISETALSEEQKILFRPAIQQLVDQVWARSRQLTLRKVAIVGGSFMAGVLCTLFFWHLFFFVPHAQLLQLWEFWGSRGFYPGRPLMVGGPGICY